MARRNPQVTNPHEEIAVVKASARPFLKWAGGKSQLIAQYLPHFPTKIDRYHEPFLGSGAVFFALRASGRLDDAQVFLSDSNEHLINCFQQVQAQVEMVIELLLEHKARHDSKYYYAQREIGLAEGSEEERAARFIYFNKTCYNGLFRVNRKGRFNVPIGRYRNPTICAEEALRSANAALHGAHLSIDSYASVASRAAPGDFVYCDPPYEPLTRTSNFTSYTMNSFSQDDQRQLEQVVRGLSAKDVAVAESNSATPLIESLYGPTYRRVEMWAPRAINSKALARGRIREYLILNYEIVTGGVRVQPPGA